MRTTITRNLLILALVPLLALAPACSGGGSDSGPSAPTPVIANFAGAWTGTYLLSGCTQSGGIALANICGSLGQTLPFRLTLTQSGANVSGSFLLGTVSFPSTGGTVGGDGSLTLTGNSSTGSVSVIATWTVRLSGSALTGNLTQVWTSTGLSGQATVVGTIVTATR